MDATSDIAGFPAADDSLPPWLWLWLPAALVVVLLAVPYVFPADVANWVYSERGILEFTHVVVPLASAVLAVMILRMPEVRRYRYLPLWLILAAVGSFYVGGEEASWGQHYLNWSTPDAWQAVNDQGETNLHNTSDWFDQKPRLLLEIGVVVGGILVPIAAWRRPEIWHSRLAIILPSKVCFPAALLAEVTRLVERFLQLVGADFRLFTRGSEVQETYFYLFILIYLLLLRLRLRRAPAATD